MTAEEVEQLEDHAHDDAPHVSPSAPNVGANGDSCNNPRATEGTGAGISETTAPAGQPHLSKTQLKKLRKKAEWEADRPQRRVQRKDKQKAKKERKREAWRQKQEEQTNGEVDNEDSNENVLGTNGEKQPVANSERDARRAKKPPASVQLPITIIFDCQFDDLMKDGELTSLASQLTRCYSDNRKSRFRAHLAISSFGGKLKERFEGVLARHHESWKGVRFLEEHFVAAAEKAKAWMAEPQGGAIAGALRNNPEIQEGHHAEPHDPAATAGEVVYLSSDSPHTLTELRPNGVYIIGGLVDRNRHKGICYKNAVEHNVRTAKLPIGEFIEMQTRTVLATNHVNEIMLKWLEFGDWGKAFFEVIPKRKGGKLREKDDDVDVDAETVDEKDEEHSTREDHTGDINEADDAKSDQTEVDGTDVRAPLGDDPVSSAHDLSNKRKLAHSGDDADGAEGKRTRRQSPTT